MSIKLPDALQHITDRKPLTLKAIASLERQIIGCLSKIEKANKKIGQIQWILKKNDELVEELKVIGTLEQLAEVETEDINNISIKKKVIFENKGEGLGDMLYLDHLTEEDKKK